MIVSEHMQYIVHIVDYNTNTSTGDRQVRELQDKLNNGYAVVRCDTVERRCAGYPVCSILIYILQKQTVA